MINWPSRHQESHSRKSYPFLVPRFPLFLFHPRRSLSRSPPAPLLRVPRYTAGLLFKLLFSSTQIHFLHFRLFCHSLFFFCFPFCLFYFLLFRPLLLLLFISIFFLVFFFYCSHLIFTIFFPPPPPLLSCSIFFTLPSIAFLLSIFFFFSSLSIASISLSSPFASGSFRSPFPFHLSLHVSLTPNLM